MNTLVLNGSPHKSGNTAALLSAALKTLPGNIQIITAYESEFAPCNDCRQCWKTDSCRIDDSLSCILKRIDTFDNILIASPVYFSTLTPPLLAVLSRMQFLYTARRFRKERVIRRPKKGSIILTGGGEGNMDPALISARSALRLMGVREIFPTIASCHTDSIPAGEDREALLQAENLTTFFTSCLK